MPFKLCTHLLNYKHFKELGFKMPYYYPPHQLTGNNIKTLYYTKIISTGNFNTALNTLVVFMQYSYNRLSLNGHPYKTDTSLKRTPRVGPYLSLLPLFDSL